MSSKLHWFPFYHDSWIVDTRHLSFKEQGLYLNLLLMQFDKGCVDLQLVRKLWPELYEEDRGKAMHEVLEQFFTPDNERNTAPQTYRRFWTNKRMREVMQEQLEKSEKRTQQTARARSAKQQKSKAVTKSVTKPVTEREIEIEIELEKELEVKQQKELISNSSGVSNASQNCSCEEAASKWNDAVMHLAGIASVRTVTNQRSVKWAKASKQKGFHQTFEEALKRLPVPNTPTFQWQPSFDWMLNVNNCTKLAEGVYDRNDGCSTDDKRTKRVARFINE